MRATRHWADGVTTEAWAASSSNDCSALKLGELIINILHLRAFFQWRARVWTLWPLHSPKSHHRGVNKSQVHQLQPL